MTSESTVVVSISEVYKLLKTKQRMMQVRYLVQDQPASVAEAAARERQDSPMLCISPRSSIKHHSLLRRSNRLSSLRYLVRHNHLIEKSEFTDFSRLVKPS